MALALLSAAVVLAGNAEALNLWGPKATEIAVFPDDGVSPVPTEAPDLKKLLAKRAGGTTVFFAPDNTCGYLYGSSDLAFTCYETAAQCAVFTASTLGAVGCCDKSGCGGFVLDCVDYDAYYTGTSCGLDCMSDTYTLKCTDATSRYCNTASINGGSLTVYGYWCADYSDSSAQPLLTTYVGEKDGRSYSASVLGSSDDFFSTATQAFTNGGETSIADTTSVPTSTTGPSSPSTTQPSSTTTASQSGGGGGGGSSAPVGAIVGGVVGGLAVISLIALGIFFLMRKKSKPDTPGTVAAVAPAPGPAPPPMAQMPPQDMHVQSMYPSPDAKAGQVQLYQQTAGPTPPPVYGGPQPLYPQPTGGSYFPSETPNRDETLSPASQFERRASAMTTASTIPGSAHPSMVSPQLPSAALMSPQPTGYAQPQPQPQVQVPTTIHEAGGNVIGSGDYNADHRGQMHELA